MNDAELKAIEKAIRRRAQEARVRRAEENARRKVDRGTSRSYLSHDEWLATLSAPDLEAFVCAVRKQLEGP